MNSAGRVLIKPCGEWKAETTYHMLDLVNHNGYAYLAKRTVVGIEPNADTECWHNLLDINKVIEDGISGSLADDVGKLLEERFAELLSEARYVTDLFADFAVPTFVRWDTATENTPYKAGITPCYEGYALVFGNSLNHTVSAWAKGGIRNDCFMHTVSDGKDYGWDNSISASGGTMTGALNLGGGKGAVSADDEGTFLESATSKLRLKNSEDIEDSVKLESSVDGNVKDYSLFGEHNIEKMSEEHNFTRIYMGEHIGTGEDTWTITFPVKPKVVMFAGFYTAVYGSDRVECSRGNTNISIALEWDNTKLTITANSALYSVEDFGNKKDRTHPYAILY